MGKRFMSVPTSAAMTWAVRRPTPGIVSTAATVVSKWVSRRATSASNSSISASRCSKWCNCRPSMNRWWSPTKPRRASSNWPSFSRSRLRASPANALGSVSPSARAAGMARPEAPSTPVATEDSLMLAPFRQLPYPVGCPAAFLHQAAPVAGQLPQFPLRPVRDEAGPQQTMLEQFCNPFSVPVSSTGQAFGICLRPGAVFMWAALTTMFLQKTTR